MAEFAPFLVYSHLRRYFRYRGLEESKQEWIDRDRFIQNLNQFHYFRVDTTDAAGKTIIVLILAADGAYARSSPSLRKFLARPDTEATARDGLLKEVIIIAERGFFGKKKLVEVFNEFRDRARGSADTYLAYAYDVFALVVPEHVSVPPHTIATDEEVLAFLTRERKVLADLPAISARDPPVAWLGARPGQVVGIDRVSETAGRAFIYRLVRA